MAPVSKPKNKKITSVQVDYLVHIQEIRPWPPSQSLRSLHFIVLQWEYGDWSSGSTNPVVPSLGSGVRDGKIEFNEYFRLPITLSKNTALKGDDVHTFQKICLEFSLYEPRRDNVVRGQLLGTAIVDLAEYGVLKETLTMSVPMNCNRNFSNTSQPVLFLKVQPLEKNRSNASTSKNLSKETSLAKNGSLHSTLIVPTNAPKPTRELPPGPPHDEQNKSESVKDNTGRIKRALDLHLEPEYGKPKVKIVMAELKHPIGNRSHSSSFSSASMIQSLESGHAPSANDSKGSLTSIPNEPLVQRLQYSSPISNEGKEQDISSNVGMRSFDRVDLAQAIPEKKVNGTKIIKESERKLVKECRTDGLPTKITSLDTDLQMAEKSRPIAFAKSHVKGEDDKKTLGHRRNEGEEEQEVIKKKENSHCTNGRPLDLVSQDVIRKQVSSSSDTLKHHSGGFGVNGNTLSSERLRHEESDPLQLDIPVMKDIKEIKDACPKNNRKTERKEAVTDHGVAKSNSCDSRVQKLGHRIEKLEEELREVAAIEIALYSVVSEHRSSPKKFLAPARRLSRFYLHAYRRGPPSRRARVARTTISGLAVVAKACGKDVPRLTFWLSNSVALRVIVSRDIESQQPPFSDSSRIQTNGSEGNAKRASLLKWGKSSPSQKEKKFSFTDKLDELENPTTFITALEKIEAWIFSRIIESLWQILIPYMKSASDKENKQNISSSLKKISGRNHRMSDQGQASFSLDLWKMALKDVYQRLCPIRADGHECACFTLLNRLIMEQCVDRLDVAMFNAFLCESADAVLTDPVSIPISDAKVLPLPAGKSSFSNGVQLKNAILNWSKWLNLLFGIDDDDDSHKCKNDREDQTKSEHKASFISFHLLNALSDLMMLPKDMLMNRSIRREVCPAFGASLIKKILRNFVPDEFSPEPIPEDLFGALDSEDSLEDKELIRKFPRNAMPVVYIPPSAASLAGIIEVKSEFLAKTNEPSMLHLHQSFVSDDELEELSSPLPSIINNNYCSSKPTRKPKETGSNDFTRYQLLQESW